MAFSACQKNGIKLAMYVGASKIKTIKRGTLQSEELRRGEMRTILKNARCYTLDQNQTVAEAILMEDGKIAAIGSNEEILDMAAAEDTIIDAEGKTVLPGFYDSHLHLLSYGYSLTMAYLDDCKSIEDVIATLKQYIKDNNIPPGTWVEGRGWNETNYPEGRVPNRHDLDRVSTEHMISIGRSCSFMCITNTKALEELGFLDKIPDVEVGSIELDEQGVPTGVFVSEAKEAVYARLPKLGVEKIKKSIIAACNKYKTAGITSAETDDFELTRAGDFHDIIQAYQELDAAGELPIRVNLMLYLPEDEQQQEFYKYGFKTGDGSDFFRIGKFKLLTDGPLGIRGAAMLEPYADDPSTLGQQEISQEALCRKVKDAYEHGLITVCDGMGDRGIYMALKAYEPIVKAHPDEDLRFGIDHSQITTEGLIEEYARLKVTGGCELVFVKSDIEITEKRVGRHRASLSYNWKRFFDNGCVVSAGSDSPVEDFNPMLGIDGAVNRRDWDNLPKEGWFPEQCLTIEQAVSAFTTGAAYANYEEKVKGSLEVGKLADMVILSDNIFEIDKNNVADVKVEKTILNGEVVYSI